MNLVSGGVTFLLIWWMVFYMTLPLYVKKQKKVGEGFDHGAPEKPYMLKKVVITTGVSLIIFGGVFYCATYKSDMLYDLIVVKGGLS